MNSNIVIACLVAVIIFMIYRSNTETFLFQRSENQQLSQKEKSVGVEKEINLNPPFDLPRDRIHYLMETKPMYKGVYIMNQSDVHHNNPIPIGPLPPLRDMVTYADDIPDGPEPVGIESILSKTYEDSLKFDQQILGGYASTTR